MKKLVKYWWAPFIALFLFFGLGGFHLIALGIFAITRDTKVPAKAKIQYDDFAFYAVSVEEVPSVEGVSAGDRSFYVLNSKVDNLARVVDFTYDVTQASMFDTSGRPLEHSTSAQRILGSEKSVLSAGGTCYRKIAFEGPRGLKRVIVRFTASGGAAEVGDVLDAILGDRQHCEIAVRGFRASSV